MRFTKAVRKKAKLKMALTGPSGSGKTYSALLLAKGLGGKIAVIDTENGSASLYDDLCSFDVLELAAPFSPERYIEAIISAEKAGYDVLIIDSATPEWSGSGGCLEINEKTAAAKFKGNTWSAWSETTPRHRKFFDVMLQSKLHVIMTGRSKTETMQTEENGKKRVVKVGMKIEQRDGFEYEFTCVLDLVHDGHYAVASKDRTRVFSGDPLVVSESTGEKLKAWLDKGDDQQVLSNEQVFVLVEALDASSVSKDEFLAMAKASKINDISPDRFERALSFLKSKQKEAAPNAAIQD